VSFPCGAAAVCSRGQALSPLPRIVVTGFHRAVRLDVEDPSLAAPKIDVRLSMLARSSTNAVSKLGTRIILAMTDGDVLARLQAGDGLLKRPPAVKVSEDEYDAAHRDAAGVAHDGSIGQAQPVDAVAAHDNEYNEQPDGKDVFPFHLALTA